MTDMNLTQLIDVLNKFDIRNASDLERRLENGTAPEAANAPGWHDGYVQGFQKASRDQIEKLNSLVEGLGSRMRTVEHNLGAVETMVRGLALARRRRPSAKAGKGRKRG